MSLNLQLFLSSQRIYSTISKDLNNTFIIVTINIILKPYLALKYQNQCYSVGHSI